MKRLMPFWITSTKGRLSPQSNAYSGMAVAVGRPFDRESKQMMKLTATLVMLATPVAAQEFSLPAGCEGYLTIQSKSCSVSHYFTCDFDAAGEQRRATLDEEGLSYVGKINSDAEWVQSFHLRSGHTEELASSADRMSMTDLLAGDLDSWDFTTESREIGDTRYVGYDRLTGEEVVIDGVRCWQIPSGH